MTSELRNWITEARKRGESYTQISTQLKSQGYSLPEIVIASSITLMLDPATRIPIIVLVIGAMLVFSGLVSHLTYDSSPTYVYPEAAAPTLNYNDITSPQTQESVTETTLEASIETTEIPEEDAGMILEVPDSTEENITKETTVPEINTTTDTNTTETTNTTISLTCLLCQYEENGECKTYTCCDALDCSDGDSTTVDECLNPSTKESSCTHTQKVSCTTDTECNDDKSFTIDTCDTLTNTCKFTATADCKDSDGTCPEGCTFRDDADCNVTDELFIVCSSSIQCYHDGAVRMMNATLCKNINFYWKDTNLTVTDTCYYNIASSLHACTTCSKITDTEKKTQCEALACE